MVRRATKAYVILTFMSLNWDEMKRAEPALDALEKIAQLDGASFYTHVKPLLLALVGWERGVQVNEVIMKRDPGAFLKMEEQLTALEGRTKGKAANDIEVWMRSEEAYDLAYETLYELTPSN